MNTFGLPDSIIDQIISVLKLFPAIEKAVIYGSRAKNTHKNYSDIDIAIYASTMTDMEFSKLWNAIDDLPVIYKCDVVHFDKLSNQKLKDKIGQEGALLYSR